MGANVAEGEVTIPLSELVRASRAVEERDRARALAAKLEEVVAMRDTVLRALVEWADDPVRRPAGELLVPLGIVEWARAQLSEVP